MICAVGTHMNAKKERVRIWMSKKISFNSKWNYLIQLIFDNSIVPDVLLMDELGFTPHTWKVWKSKFIERSQYGTCSKKNYNTNEIVDFKIIYDKKQKLWKYEKTSTVE